MDDVYQQALKLHRDNRGKIALAPKVSVKNRTDLSLAYTPGVAEACRVIAANPEEADQLTARRNWVAVVTDGSAVLGLGDIGPAAAAPVMEGKCVLFKEFAGLDAFPIMLTSRDTDTIVATVKNLEWSFGAINLEDIAAPRCFDIERRLIEELAIPVMHDDQHGTAIVVAAGVVNAVRVTGRDIGTTRFVIGGAGAAGTAIADMLLHLGAHDIVATDRGGVLGPSRVDLNAYKDALRARTNPRRIDGGLEDALRGADVFIGVSGPGTVSAAYIRAMAPHPIVFALSNPTPEIFPDEAHAAGAAVVATGRSDFPNQVNNVLAYPGVFRGAIDAKARRITEPMKRAAVYALAGMVPEPTANLIIPDVFTPGVAEAVANAVMRASIETA